MTKSMARIARRKFLISIEKLLIAGLIMRFALIFETHGACLHCVVICHLLRRSLVTRLSEILPES